VWFDEEDSDKTFHVYYTKVPEKKGDLYFLTEGYYWKMLSTSCTRGMYEDYFGKAVFSVVPIVYFSVYNLNTRQM
jgi:hypothetical protein